MKTIFIDDEPYKITQLTKHFSVVSPNRMPFVGQKGDYILLDRWMNLTLVDGEAMNDFLNEAGMRESSKDGAS